MTGQISDLMFQIVARDQTRAAFDSAKAGAQGFETALVSSSKRASAGVKSVDGAVGNIAAQFSDIGVQLAGGQSPFLIALQQGTQITQVFGSAGAAGAVSMLGQAAMSLLSPINLITIAAIAGGGALLQMFMNSGRQARTSAEALQEFDALVERIGKTSEVTAESIKKMLNMPESWAGLRADVAEMQRSLQSDLKAGIKDVVGSLSELQVQARVPLSPEIVKARTELYELGKALKAGKVSATEAYEQLNRMATAETTPPSLFTTIAAIRTALKDAVALQLRLNSLGGTAPAAIKGDRVGSNSFDDLRRFSDNSSDVIDFNARMGSYDPKEVTDELKEQAKALHDVAGGSSKAKSEAEKHADAVKKVMENLDAERAKLGLSATEQRVMDELRKAGADAASQEGIAIANKVRALEAEKAAQAAVDKALQESSALGKDVFGGIVRGIRDGTSAAELFESALTKISDKLIDMQLNALFDGSVAGSGGGVLGNLFGWLTGGTASAASGGAGAAGGVAAKVASASNTGLAKVAANRNVQQSAKVEVHNYSGARISAEERDDGRGGRMLHIQAEDTIASANSRPGSSANRALRSTFNLQPSLTRR